MGNGGATKGTLTGAATFIFQLFSRVDSLEGELSLTMGNNPGCLFSKMNLLLSFLPLDGT